VELVVHHDLAARRDVEVEVELERGRYLVLPLTSGVLLRSSKKNAPNND